MDKKPFNKKRFMKYRIIPFILFIWATIFSLLIIILVSDVKSIPDGVILLVIVSTVLIWAITIDSNIDSHHRELRDIINDRLPEKEKLDHG